MNAKDTEKLTKLNERYGPSNLTGFRIVGAGTPENIILNDIERVLKTLESSDIKSKRPCRVIIFSDSIDICTVDNATPVSYFFTQDAEFTSQSMKGDVRAVCDSLDVACEEFTDINGVMQ